MMKLEVGKIYFDTNGDNLVYLEPELHTYLTMPDTFKYRFYNMKSHKLVSLKEKQVKSLACHPELEWQEPEQIGIIAEDLGCVSCQPRLYRLQQQIDKLENRVDKLESKPFAQAHENGRRVVEVEALIKWLDNCACRAAHTSRLSGSDEMISFYRGEYAAYKNCLNEIKNRCEIE